MIPRARAIEALTEERFDVAVIGGGITGAGVALDAASRGFSVALIEKADFAAGTSSRSSKLIHGGLRYLQKFDLALVREALLERQLMVKLAPHLVKPLPMVVPAFGGARPDRLTGIGLNMYDVMAAPGLRSRRRRIGTTRRSGTTRRASTTRRTDATDDAEAADWSPARHRQITSEEVAALLPALANRDPTGGYLFYDCQTDDARLVLTVLGEAERFGAICANRLEAVALNRHQGTTQITVQDAETHARLTLSADNVVSATGVWADRIPPANAVAKGERPRTSPSPGEHPRTSPSPGQHPRTSPGPGEHPRITPSRGTHLTVAHADLPLSAGAIIRAQDGRSIFALPWLGSSLIGTTDSHYDGDIDHVRPAPDDLDYLLRAVNEFFGTELQLDQLTGAYAGVRPLVSAGEARKSVDISRRAELYEAGSGVITITGGKLTTWRRMAKLVVDRLVERDGRHAPCRTHEIPLGAPVDPQALHRVNSDGVPADAYGALAARYGYAAHRVLAHAAEDPRLSQPILPGHPDLLAEAPFSARHEQAGSVADVLFRRTRLALLAAPQLCDPDSEVPLAVARALAPELGWDEDRIELEVHRFADEAEAEGIAPGVLR
jgi:glycerol-3-phosphate dehydrogenase